MIRLFDPAFDLAAIRPKRRKSTDTARRGEMARAMLGVLRGAAGPMTTAEVAAAVVAARGMDRDDHKTAARTANLIGSAPWRQQRNGTVRAERGQGQSLLWEIGR